MTSFTNVTQSGVQMLRSVLPVGKDPQNGLLQMAERDGDSATAVLAEADVEEEESVPDTTTNYASVITQVTTTEPVKSPKVRCCSDWLRCGDM